MGAPNPQSNRCSQASPSRRFTLPQRHRSLQTIQGRLEKLQVRFAPLVDFWTKINNDWIFNWAAGLAYTLLTSILPIFLAILAIGGLILGSLSVSSIGELQSVLASGLPGGAGGAGGQIVTASLQQFHSSAGVLLVIGVVGAIIAGSGLFLSLESAFGIIFRVKGRDPVPQRVMAVSMVLLYVLLVPIMVFASLIPAAVLGALHVGKQNPGGAFLLQALGLAVGLVTSLVFFGSIYFVVPNRRMKWGEVWPGTVVAAVLLVLYELVFPIYENLFLRGNYGSIIGLLVVVLIFLYYLAFILLIGAEINSTVLGLRPTTESLSALLQSLQERDLMIQPQNHDSTGKQALETRPPLAHLQESTSLTDTWYVPASPPTTAGERAAKPAKGQAALAALLVAGSVACIGLLCLGVHLVRGEKVDAGSRPPFTS